MWAKPTGVGPTDGRVKTSLKASGERNRNSPITLNKDVIAFGSVKPFQPPRAPQHNANAMGRGKLASNPMFLKRVRSILLNANRIILIIQK